MCQVIRNVCMALLNATIIVYTLYLHAHAMHMVQIQYPDTLMMQVLWDVIVLGV